MQDCVMQFACKDYVHNPSGEDAIQRLQRRNVVRIIKRTNEIKLDLKSSPSASAWRDIPKPMHLQLRPTQIKAVSDIRSKMDEYACFKDVINFSLRDRTFLLQAPCAFGKTYVMAALGLDYELWDDMGRGITLFIFSKREVLNQVREKFSNLDFLRTFGWKEDEQYCVQNYLTEDLTSTKQNLTQSTKNPLAHPILFTTVQTLKSVIHLIPPTCVKMILCDEADSEIVTKEYGSFIHYFSEAFICMFSATGMTKIAKKLFGVSDVDSIYMEESSIKNKTVVPINSIVYVDVVVDKRHEKSSTTPSLTSTDAKYLMSANGYKSGELTSAIIRIVELLFAKFDQDKIDDPRRNPIACVVMASNRGEMVTWMDPDTGEKLQLMPTMAAFFDAVHEYKKTLQDYKDLPLKTIIGDYATEKGQRQMDSLKFSLNPNAYLRDHPSLRFLCVKRKMCRGISIDSMSCIVQLRGVGSDELHQLYGRINRAVGTDGHPIKFIRQVFTFAWNSLTIKSNQTYQKKLLEQFDCEESDDEGECKNEDDGGSQRDVKKRKISADNAHSKRYKTRPPYKCGRCGQQGHTARNPKCSMK